LGVSGTNRGGEIIGSAGGGERGYGKRHSGGCKNPMVNKGKAGVLNRYKKIRKNESVLRKKRTGGDLLG